MPTSQKSTIHIAIAAFGAVEKLLPTELSYQFAAALSISEVLMQLAQDYPAASAMLERCACAIGEDIVPRQTQLTTDTTVVLLSPVAGG